MGIRLEATGQRLQARGYRKMLTDLKLPVKRMKNAARKPGGLSMRRD
jgi:hypothetical protein